MKEKITIEEYLTNKIGKNDWHFCKTSRTQMALEISNSLLRVSFDPGVSTIFIFVGKFLVGKKIKLKNYKEGLHFAILILVLDFNQSYMSIQNIFLQLRNIKKFVSLPCCRSIIVPYIKIVQFGFTFYYFRFKLKIYSALFIDLFFFYCFFNHFVSSNRVDCGWFSRSS